MSRSVPAVAFSHGPRLVFALGLALLGAEAARAEEPPATSAAPTAPAPASVAAVPLAKARKALAAKRWRDAQRAAEDALGADATSLEAKAYLGLADKGLGDCKAALAPLEAAFVNSFAGNAGVPGVAGALAACLGDKAPDKQKLAEARLAAAREAAGAGHDAEARGLYGAALGAALLTLPVEMPEEASAETSAPPSEAPATGDVPDTAAAERAHAEAAAEAAKAEAAKAEAAKAEAARQEEARRAAAPPVAVAPVVVATMTPPPASRPPLAFQVGIRSAASARDASGTHHPDDAGLVFTWLTFAAPYSRAALVLDLESTRWRSAREDVMSGGATAFYGLGLDWSVPFMMGGTGLVVGAEAMGGVLQSATMGQSKVDSGVALQLTPHAGAVVMLKNVGLFLDAGWRVQLAESSSLGKASEGGFVFQGGLRVEMQEREPAPGGFAIGYTARFYAPNGSNIYSAYGGLPATNSKGPLLGHELTLTTGAGLPRRLEHGAALTYVGSDRASGPSFQMFGVAYLATVHAFATRQLLNPYLGAQLGVVYIRHDETEAFSQGAQPGAVGTLRAGLDADVARRVRLRAGFAYDLVEYANNVPNGSLSGYAVEAGAIIRL